MRGTIVALGGTVVVGSFCGLAAISAQAPASPAAPSSRAVIEAGRKRFADTCSSDYCHGDGGKGGGAPSLAERRYTIEFLTRTISKGVPSTAMPAFGGTLTSDQVAELAAYVRSLSGADTGTTARGAGPPPPGGTAGRQGPDQPTPKPPPPSPQAPAPKPGSSAAEADLPGDAAAGRAIFFDATESRSCRVCHTFDGWGGHVGPDLTKIGTRSARDLFLKIVLPRPAADSPTGTVALTTRDGQRFVGVKSNEDAEAVQVFDVSSSPPVRRTFLKANVAKIEKLTTPAMPGDYASRYSLKQLLDLVAFLKSGDPAWRGDVTLRGLF